eukprot:COSAG01_NODE_6601_length_3585_cov_61.162651_2_plen_42_part_00
MRACCFEAALWSPPRPSFAAEKCLDAKTEGTTGIASGRRVE